MMRDELGETSGDLEFYDRNYREKKEALLPNLIIFAVFGMDDDETDETLIYFAEVRSLPPESGPGSQSVKVHWLDEVEGDVYELDSSKQWRGIKSIAISTIVDVAPPMRKLAAANGRPDQWVLRRGDGFSATAEAAIQAHQKPSTWADKVTTSRGSSSAAGSTATGGVTASGMTASGERAGGKEKVQIDLVDEDDGVTEAASKSTLKPESVELRRSHGMI
eukprot:4990965-Prymnesium_polylepis.1